MNDGSVCVWYGGGEPKNHSTCVFFPRGIWISRLLVSASHTMNRDISTATIEMVDPMDDIVFHRVKASGKSEYRRGIPDNPRKCCGKNVILTPTNITQNWVFVIV